MSLACMHEAGWHMIGHKFFCVEEVSDVPFLSTFPGGDLRKIKIIFPLIKNCLITIQSFIR